jgi:hypothetical protein
MRAKAKAILAKSILNASSKLKDIAGRLEKVLSSVSSELFGTYPPIFVDCNTTAAGI